MKSIKLIALTLVIVLVACVFVSCNQQEKALEEAKAALSVYHVNYSKHDTGMPDHAGTIFVVERSGKWYSYTFDGTQFMDDPVVTDTTPTTPENYVLEDNEDLLLNMPDNITIYIPKP